jgi:hypothetical protein
MKILMITICAALVFLGCSDDDCVQCPPDNSTNPTIENIWPNADKTAWTYAYEVRQWGSEPTIYPTRDDIPTDPLPTWSEIFAVVEAHAPVEPYLSEEGEYRIRFDGMTTTGPGVTAQNLVSEFLSPVPPLAPSAALNPASRFMTITGQQRGDLVSKSSVQVPAFPHLIHGGAWEKTSQWIGTYGELYPELGWKFLTQDLSPGAEFSWPLVTSIAEGAMLYGRVYRHVTVRTILGTFAKAVDCLYIVDLGILTITDFEGHVVGYMRQLEYGRVIYAPTVGPVYSYEIWGAELGGTMPDGLADITLTLIGLSAEGD